MAKIAVESKPIEGLGNGRAPGRPVGRLLACGDGWSVSEMTCSAGPHDRPFEERHSDVCIAIVMAGSFQYRSTAGRELMTPGSLLLGNPGQYFECGHEHGVGDRCISFSYRQRYFEGLATEGDAWVRNARFTALRVPPVRQLSSLVARARAGLAECADTAPGREQSALGANGQKLARNYGQRASSSNGSVAKWEEIAIELASRALHFSGGRKPSRGSSLAAEARVTRIVRMIEGHLDSDHDLDALAREAKLSRYHFLRIFQQLTGLTPHHYVLRTRLRSAATRLILESGRVLDIALDSGFGDVSNFNHAFRTEFGVSPRSYRKKCAA